MHPENLPVLVMTRPEPQSLVFVEAVKSHLGYDIPTLLAPLISIEPTHTLLDLPEDWEAIFTSANGVRFAPDGQGRRAYCVGESTAQAARRKGYDAVSADGNAQDLLDMLAAFPRGTPLVHLCGEATVGHVVERLTAKEVSAKRLVLYRQVPQDLNDTAHALITGERQTLVALFSPMAARIFASQFPTPPDRSSFCCLSPAVRAELGDWDVKSIIAKAPNRDEMLASICQFYSRFPLP